MRTLSLLGQAVSLAVLGLALGQGVWVVGTFVLGLVAERRNGRVWILRVRVTK